MNVPVAAEKVVGFVADADLGSLLRAEQMWCTLADLDSILLPIVQIKRFKIAFIYFL